MMLPTIGQPIPEPTEHTICILQGGPNTTQMPFPSNLDPDYMQELAERLDDHARQLDREVQDLKKRAQEFRAAATRSKGLEHSNTLDPVDKEGDQL